MDREGVGGRGVGQGPHGTRPQGLLIPQCVCPRSSEMVLRRKNWRSGETEEGGHGGEVPQGEMRGNELEE